MPEVSESARSVLEHIPGPSASAERFVIAIAGPPAAGKSTLASALVEALGGRAGLLGMDGFHLDNSILDSRGHRLRKGAPHTFDVNAFGTVLRALRSDRHLEMAVPVYDRTLSVSRNCASLVQSNHDVLVTEGNYLLLDDLPWSALRELYDLTVWLEVPLDVVEERIIERWTAAGLAEDEIARRTQENDLPNARLVHTGSGAADIVMAL